jgi:hypothetical protein
MPPDVARGFKVGTMKIDGDAQLKRYEKSYAKMVQFVGIMYKAGVPIVAGTDDIPGFTLHSELALLVKAGLTPAQALQVATRNGARYTGTTMTVAASRPASWPISCWWTAIRPRTSRTCARCRR